MTYLRKHYMNILLFLLWIGMSVSLVTSHVDAKDTSATVAVEQP